MIRIILADDHPVVRDGVKVLLSLESDMIVVGEADDAPATIQSVASHQPDVLLLDLKMPGFEELDLIARVLKASRKTRILVYSGIQSEATIVAALRAGASGYCLKSGSPEELVRGIRELAVGRTFLGSALHSVCRKPVGSAVEDPFDSLTDRELATLRLASVGLSNTEIAKQMQISPRTVEHHRASVMQKLSLRSHSHLVLYAMRRGMIHMDEGEASSAFRD